MKARPAPATARVDWRIGRSPVHGRGLFAARRLPADRLLLTYKGRRTTWATLPPRRDPGGHTMLFALPDDRHVVDGDMALNPARFLNHCCTPNCIVLYRHGHLRIRTLRRIERGAELFIDYRLTHPAPRSLAARRQLRCRCGARGCRGTMLGA